MGGAHFANLSTPRLLQVDYDTILAQVLQRIQPHFVAVHPPLPYPGKLTHGDVDLLVHTFRDEKTLGWLSEHLGAVQSTFGVPTSHFAIPFKDFHVQIDIHCCSPQSFEWEVFLHDYGVVNYILSHMVKAFGISLNQQGLSRKVQNQTFIFSLDRDTIIDFLDLDRTIYVEGFETPKALYEWLESGRIENVPLLYGFDREKFSKNRQVKLRFADWLERRSADLPTVVEEPIDQARVLNLAAKHFKVEERFTMWTTEVQESIRLEEAKRKEAQCRKAWMQPQLEGLTGNERGRKAEALLPEWQQRNNTRLSVDNSEDCQD